MTQSTENNFHYMLKYIIIGDSAVGKSNILLRFTQDKYKAEHQITIGVEFGSKNITIDEKIYRIQIWDTAGQENFRSITRAYYKNSVCAMIVYDIANIESFKNIQQWIEDCKSQSPKTIFMVLIGNKSDLAGKREVTYEEGLELANRNRMLFFETSAKDGYNIEQAFEASAKEIGKRLKNDYYDLSNDVCGIKQGFNAMTTSEVLQLSSRSKKVKKGCC